MSCFCMFSHVVSASVFDQMFDAFRGRFWHPFGIDLASKNTCFFVLNFQCFFYRFYAKMGPKRGPKMTPKSTLLAPKIHTFPQGVRFWEPLAHMGWFWRLFGRILVPFECIIPALLVLFGTFTGLSWAPGRFSANAPFIAPSYRQHAPSFLRIRNLPTELQSTKWVGGTREA